MDQHTAEHLDKIRTFLCMAMKEFDCDAKKAIKGNKTAARRSRKKSLEIEKVFKEWRLLTLKAGLK